MSIAKQITQQSAEALARPGLGAFAVTPNDSADLSIAARSLWVGVAGDVSVDTVYGDTAVVLKNVQGILPLAVVRVRATSTTATDIVALY